MPTPFDPESGLTPDEQHKLDRDRRTLRRREIEVKPRKPLPGQRSMFPAPRKAARKPKEDT